ncbi:MAG: sigma-70 family RNA polymerase sigma factor [Ignavibacteria bacterium]|nr:sigma-70 family RNA polymerase sigma factor [Ignavibacteria bacterium]
MKRIYMSQRTSEVRNLDTDQEMVSLIRKGDRTGISDLYDKYAPVLFALIYRIIQRKDLAEDLLQEVFVKIWMNIESYDPDKSKFSTWIVNIARNLTIDTLRSKNFKNQSKNLSDDSYVNIVDDEVSFSINTDYIGIDEVLNKVLSDENKKIIDIVYFKGYTQAEAAKSLNMPLGTLKTKLRTAIKVLREHLK